MIGFLVTIEGIDGSGKGTQAKLLFDTLKQASVPVKMYSFPCYEDTFFGKEVGAFLRGEFGTLEQVHPKLSSILFAGDRFERKGDIERDLSDGCIVICDRYVDSNIAHQCAKLPDEKRNEFSLWLETLEYNIFGIRRPDLTFFLDVPLEVSKSLVLKKSARSYTEKKEDIHEASYEYLHNVYSAYIELAEKRGWFKISCLQGANIRSVHEIGEEILSHVKSYRDLS